MRTNLLLEDDINFDKLAEDTKNYTGAEIEAVCRSATSYALFAELDLSNIGSAESAKTAKSTAKPIKNGTTKGGNSTLSERKVRMADFLLALQEIKPAFGVNNDELGNYIRGGIHKFGERFDNMY